MNIKFDFDKYDDHDFYHVRMGRGAVVVAVKKSQDERQFGESHSGLNVAQTFCSREQTLDGDRQQMDPIQSIKEKDGVMEIEIKFRRLYRNPPYRPMSAVIKRILPSNQVTFEIVASNDHD